MRLANGNICSLFYFEGLRLSCGGLMELEKLADQLIAMQCGTHSLGLVYEFLLNSTARWMKRSVRCLMSCRSAPELTATPAASSCRGPTCPPTTSPLVVRSGTEKCDSLPYRNTDRRETDDAGTESLVSQFFGWSGCVGNCRGAPA